MVQLLPMSEAELAEFLRLAIPDYASEHVRTGEWPAEGALERSAAEFQELLPGGVGTPDHYLFTIYEPEIGAAVGMLWFAVRASGAKRSAFVYNLQIDEPYRRRGYASQAFLAMEPYVRALGISEIGLHVFGHNHAAQAMYAKLGYQVTNIMMKKTLEDSSRGEPGA